MNYCFIIILIFHEFVRNYNLENITLPCMVTPINGPGIIFTVNSLHSFCYQCSSECSNSCSGPLESQCKTCRNYRIYVEGKPGMNNTKFNCTATCPHDLPYKIFPEDASDPYCGKDPFPLSL